MQSSQTERDVSTFPDHDPGLRVAVIRLRLEASVFNRGVDSGQFSWEEKEQRNL